MNYMRSYNKFVGSGSQAQHDLVGAISAATGSANPTSRALALFAKLSLIINYFYK
jgi:hypothetical protein